MECDLLFHYVFQLLLVSRAFLPAGMFYNYMNTVATKHMWLLRTKNVTSWTEKLNFVFIPFFSLFKFKWLHMVVVIIQRMQFSCFSLYM